jgi:internalin A
MELRQRLEEWIKQELDRSGCRDWEITRRPDAPRPARPRKAGRRGRAESALEDSVVERPLTFSPPPSTAITYCVSYAWNDQSKAVVDRLCEESTRRGITILRDTTGMGLGESIIRFMQRLGAGDRVFVILSDKYLKSAFCMYELMEVWRNSKMADEEFRRRIRTFRLPGVEITTPLDRARHAVFWKQQFNELDTLVREHGPTVLGEMDFKRYKLMQDFAHRVGDVLALIADTLQPTDLDQLIAYGFGDEAPSTPPP